jgi:phage shock protein PspC (stress-responsive transcriptional regulator)
MTPQDPPTTPQDTPPPPPPPPPAPPRRLVRTTDDRMLGGVAAGLARHFDLDPALVRIAFVVLSLLGGSGIAIYAILWLVLPTTDAPAPLGTGTGTSTSGTQKAVLIGLLVMALCVLPFTSGGVFFAFPALFGLAVVGAIGVLLWRAVGGESQPGLARAAVIVVVITGAATLGLGAGLAAAFGGGTIVAVTVIVAGAALVIGGIAGGARWLIVPALVLALPLAIVAATDLDLRGGVGQRDYRPASMQDLRHSYRLGVGELRLDLRYVALPAGRTDLNVHVGVGRAEITVPDTVCVQTRGRVGIGEVLRFGRSSNGIDVNLDHRPGAPAGTPVLFLDTDAGVGQIQIDHQPGSRSSEWGRWNTGGAGAGTQRACLS